MSKVTVIIPVYNAQQYLSQAVESVRAQTFKDWRMIIVDDGSQDESLSICRNYALKDSRIHVISQRNAGPAKAVRTGIESADTEWCMFLDADDWYSPQMIRSLYDNAVYENADCVRTGYQKVDSEGRIISKPLIIDHAVYESQQIETEILTPFFEKDADIYHHWSAPRWDKIYRTSLLRQVVIEMGDQLPRTGEDLLLTLHYLMCCNKVVSLPDASYYNYRVLVESLARGYRPSMEEENRKYIEAVAELALKTGREFKAQPVMEDNNILNLLYELKHTDHLKQSDKKDIEKRLKMSLHDRKKAWKLVLYEEFPGKKALQNLKHMIRG